MRLKIDENLPEELATLFGRAGHDATTVYGQGLRGNRDETIAAVCAREGRVLVTLDLDFADVRAFPPSDYAGIIVFRVTNQSRENVLSAGGRLLGRLTEEPPVGQLWIVDDARIRVRV